ncbi:MAG TPA: antibiotic biosynthesis monooxygenase, partial [Allosphingosinicella sp.]|nr:antibiotic biosynthesis monooxygenase [Allosphingosinicella sp.]
MTGFAVIYRWSVEAEHQAAFRARWHAGTLALREEHGAFGSCLTRDENGDFVAIALWPSEAARAAAFAARGSGAPWQGVLEFEEIRLDVEDDLWRNSPFGGP